MREFCRAPGDSGAGRGGRGGGGGASRIIPMNREKMTAEVAPGITVRASHFLPEMVILALHDQQRLVEIPLNYQARLGESKITGNFKGLVRTALRMTWLILRYAVVPPKIVAPPRA